MGIGDELRSARTGHDITIEQLSNVTKISPTILRAMEAEDLARLPGGVFTRGFLRAFAREVGLDPEETVARFRAQFEPRPPTKESGGQDSAGIVSGADDVSEDDSAAAEHSADRTPVVAALLVVILGAVGYLALHRRPALASAPTSAVAAEAEPTSTTVPPPSPRDIPVATAGVMPASNPLAAVAAELEIVIEPRDACWADATADGTRVVYRMMNAGDRATISAHDTVTLRVGDAAACAFTVNGAAGRPLGTAGQAVTVRITRQNYREFLVR